MSADVSAAASMSGSRLRLRDDGPMAELTLRRVPDGPRTIGSAFRRVRRYEVDYLNGESRTVTLRKLDSVLHAREAPADFWACVRAADSAFAEGRLEARVEWPSGREICSWTDARLSRAVLAYVWGLAGRSWPSRDPDAIVGVLGDEGLDVTSRVEAIFRFVDGISDAEWPQFAGSLKEMADSIEAKVQAAYPQLSAEAVAAIGNEWAFGHR